MAPTTQTRRLTAGAAAPNQRTARSPLRALAHIPMAAPSVFFAIMLGLGAVTPGYDAISRMGSELSLGAFGWIMIANFLCFGMVELAFAVAMWRAIGPAFSGRLAAAMVLLAGIAFLDAGVFITDPAGAPVTAHGVLHVLAAVTLFFFAFPIGGLAMAWRFRRQRVFAVYSALTAIATPLLLIATFTSGNEMGLMERVLIGVDLAWLTVLAYRLKRAGAQARALRSAPPSMSTR